MADACASIQWQLEALQAVGEQIDEVVTALPDGCVKYVSAYASGPTINIKGDKDTLTQVFKVMRSLKYFCNSARPVDKEPTWTGEFTHSEINKRPVQIAFGSTVCKRVQVGTKTVTKTIEEPVYEVQCDEPVVEPQAEDPDPENVGVGASDENEAQAPVDQP